MTKAKKTKENENRHKINNFGNVLKHFFPCKQTHSVECDDIPFGSVDDSLFESFFLKLRNVSVLQTRRFSVFLFSCASILVVRCDDMIITILAYKFILGCGRW